MKVSELAKTLKIPAGIVLVQSKKMGLDVASTISTFSDGDLKKVQSFFTNLSQADLAELVKAFENSKANRKAKAESIRKEDAANNAVAVEASRKTAEAASQGIEIKVATPTPEAVKSTPKPAPEKSTPAPEAKPVKQGISEQPKVEKIVTKTVPPAVAKPAPAKPAVPQKPAQPVQHGGQKPLPRVATQSQNSQQKKAPQKTYISQLDDEADLPNVPGNNDKNSKSQRQTKQHGNMRNNNNNNRNFNQHSNKFRQPSQQQNSQQKAQQQPANTVATGSVSGKVIQLRGPATVKELADLMGMRPNMVIADLMKLSVLASINQRLDLEVSQKIAAKYGFTIEEQSSKRSAERKPVIKTNDADDDIPEDTPEQLRLRPPVVTFMGHVDHGKTTLVDYIRKTKVAAGEAGGITQHIGAYTVTVQDRQITFIDTPGHAAFSAMRARGANLTDIAVIVVAADDGVMPQTKEAIQHARDAGVQILVAINKCDKPDAKVDRVRQMLQAEGLTPEEWGGDIVCCEVSGITGAGIDNLLDMILLQSDVLELQANPERRANGAVIESQLEQGLGPTATLLVQGGTLHVGDIILCGEFYGKVRALINERGERVQGAAPSIAVKCTGLSGVPEAGSTFRVMLNEKRARELSEKTAEENKLASLSNAQAASMADWTTRLGGDSKHELSVILKADTQGTAEAVAESLKELKSKKVGMKIVYCGVGSIAQTDVQRAGTDGQSIIAGFNVSCEPGVQSEARKNNVRINTFRIIYELIEHVKRCMLTLIPVEYKEVVRGHAEIRQVFDIGKLGKIAGCQMFDGSLRMKGKFRILRNNKCIFDGSLSTMKHFKNDVQEITGAQECGLGFTNFESFQEGDLVECYEMEELPKSL